jgi:CHRD domain
MSRAKGIPLVVALAAAAAAVTAVSAAGTSTRWTAKLNAAQEVPKQAVRNLAARGTFTATLNGTRLKYTLTFSRLSGKATAAHIHLAARGKAGPILLALCGPCKSPVSGTVTITAAVKQDFAQHRLYVNVHTRKNPAGEIRGQLGA